MTIYKMRLAARLEGIDSRGEEKVIFRETEKQAIMHYS